MRQQKCWFKQQTKRMILQVKCMSPQQKQLVNGSWVYFSHCSSPNMTCLVIEQCNDAPATHVELAKHEEHLIAPHRNSKEKHTPKKKWTG